MIYRRLPQDSPYIEWYYRSLRPNVHYIPFWLYDRDDLLHVLRGITNKVGRATASCTCCDILFGIGPWCPRNPSPERPLPPWWIWQYGMSWQQVSTA